jgi:hypothetical protein
MYPDTKAAPYAGIAARSLKAIDSTVMDSYEVFPRKDHRGIVLISDARSFGRL